MGYCTNASPAVLTLGEVGVAVLASQCGLGNLHRRGLIVGYISYSQPTGTGKATGSSAQRIAPHTQSTGEFAQR